MPSNTPAAGAADRRSGDRGSAAKTLGLRQRRVEVGVSDYAFEQTVSDIICHVRHRRLAGVEGSVWSAMVAGFRKQGACDGGIVEVIEEAIEAHLAGLQAAEVRALWDGCESSHDDSDAVRVSAAELRRFLEPELLARITDVAGEEARSTEAQRSSRRAPKRARG